MKRMSRTFTVSGVTPATQRLAALDREQALSSLVHGRVEQMWTSDARLVLCDSTHPLVQMAHKAFYEHRPIVLSPDAIWFCLAQGLAHHVSCNVERLRKRFVKHDGKVKLVVMRPDFVLGQANPWPEAFAAFSEQMALHLGKLRDLVVADFSTTGPVERAASEVVLMDAFQGYFEYAMMVGCGIPAITLRGTPDDWRSVRQRAQMFSDLDPELEPWTRALLPVLDRIVRTAEGHDDAAFWQSFFHYKSGSMGSELTGWIHVLFPYLHRSVPVPEAQPYEEPRVAFERELQRARQRTRQRSKEPSTPDVRGHAAVGAPEMRRISSMTSTSESITFRMQPPRPSREDLRMRALQAPVVSFNPHLGQWEREYQAAAFGDRSERLTGPYLAEIPSGLASAPVEVTDISTGATHRMRFIAGMFGVVEDADGALAPEFGWAVVHDPGGELQ
jgi:hypothetical protein